MKTRTFRLTTFLLLSLLAANKIAATPGDTLNLASKASITTSYVSSWESLSAVSDGLIPLSSSSKTVAAYGNWSGTSAYKTYNWVQYEWPKAQHLLSTAVFWWSDGNGILQPTDAYISYWNGVSWIKAGGIGKNLNQYNTLNLNVLTSKIRIYMVSNAATGMFEWKTTGVESGSCPAVAITPFVKTNGEAIKSTNSAVVTQGDSVIFEPTSGLAGSWAWAGPNGFLASGQRQVISNLTPAGNGTYTCCFTSECGAQALQYFYLTVDSTGTPGAPMKWEAYNPTLRYRFKDEYPSLAMPTKDLPDCSNIAGTISSGWWTFKWGPNKRSLIDSTCVMPMLKRLNEEFVYFRDNMGWPPDLRVQKGYRSAVYLYGSGMCTDNADSTALGGWQGTVAYNGTNYPIIMASYYPIYCFSPKCNYNDKEYNTHNMVHEGIHCVLTSLPGCKQADWIQEAGNTWLQQEADARRTGDYSSMGFLNSASLLAPFIPIESYRGWLQDDSFGGPGMEGVTVMNGTTSLCTWRNLLGGIQYSNTFTTFLGLTLGIESQPWIWRNCPGRVLEGMAAKLGDRAMRRLICEYRAKMAMLDFGPWSKALKTVLNDNFGTTIKAESTPSWKNPASWYASPYVRTTVSNTGLITPEYRTTPGWSGANQIPLTVTGNEVTVNFQPLAPNMTCQLCYQSKAGELVYGKIVNGGDCTLKLSSAPMNNVVIAVICNTDYIYEGDTTRKKHFDYRLQTVKGITGVASYTTRWYNYYVATEDVTETPAGITFRNPVRKGETLEIQLEGSIDIDAELRVYDVYGRLRIRKKVNQSGYLEDTASLNSGMYLVVFRNGKKEQTEKLVIQ